MLESPEDVLRKPKHVGECVSWHNTLYVCPM